MLLPYPNLKTRQSLNQARKSTLRSILFLLFHGAADSHSFSCSISSSCLGMWRFHYIDISGCPQLPDRFAAEAKFKGESPDLLRASQALGLSTKQFEELSAELQ